MHDEDKVMHDPKSNMSIIGTVPHNNYEILSQSLRGKMLIEYALEAAQECKLIKDIFLPEQVSHLNLERYLKVKGFFSSQEDVFLRIENEMEIFCILNLCNPQLKAYDISGAAKVLSENSNAEIVESIIESDPVPGRIWKLDGQMISYFDHSKPFERRQDQVKGYLTTGDLTIFKMVRNKSIREQTSSRNISYGYEIPASRAFKVLDHNDVLTVENFMSHNQTGI